MEQPYVYEQEEYEEGITFKKIGYFFKKGWLRMIVYAVIMALIATVIAVPIKVFYKSEPIAQTSVEFVYDGIEEGLAPDGSTLNTDNIISTTVLSNAVEAAELNGVITDISELREKMRVEGVESKEYTELVQAAANGDVTAAETLRTYENFPTRFIIIISEPKELGLSDDQAKALLDKIVAKYYEDFQTRYSVANMFAADIYIMSENEQSEFFDIYDKYTTTLSAMRAYLNEISAKSPSFVSTKNSTTFNKLLSELTALENSYSIFNSFITSNNLWRNKDIAASSLAITVKTLESRVNSQEGKVRNLETQVENFKPNTKQNESTGGSLIVTATYPDSYYDLQDQLTNAYEELRILQNQLADAQLRLDNLGELPDGEDKYPATEPALISAALNQIRNLETASAELTEKVNSTITDYYDTTFISSSVRQVLPAQVSRRSLSFNIIVVYLAVIVAAVLIASLVTCVKISKANTAKAEAEKAAQINAEDKNDSADKDTAENNDDKSAKKTSKK